MIDLVKSGDYIQIQKVIQEEKGKNEQRIRFFVENGARDAILLQKREIVQIFLDEGLQPDALAEEGNEKRPLIHFAAKVGSLPIVKLLVERGAPVKQEHFVYDNQDAMRAAIEGGFYPVVEYLLRKGANPNGVYGAMHKLNFLSKAALKGDEEICQLLLQNGADVKAALKDLFYKYMRVEGDLNYIQAVKLLLDFAQGVDFEKSEHNDVWTGLRFLNFDVSGCNFVGISIAGKPIERKDLKGKGVENAIVTFSDMNKLEGPRRIKLFERLGAAAKEYGMIVLNDIVRLDPFENSLSKGDLDTVSFLLYRGVVPNQRAIVIAVEKQYEEIVRILALHPKTEKKYIAEAAEIATRKNLKIASFLNRIK